MRLPLKLPLVLTSYSDRHRPQDCPHNRIVIQRHRVRRSNRWTPPPVVLGEDRSKRGLPFIAYPFQHILRICHERTETFRRRVHLQDALSIDIRYADDTPLLSAVFEKLQLSTAQLETAC